MNQNVTFRHCLHFVPNEQYYAMITCLRAQVDKVKKQLSVQKECAAVANFGTQTFLIVNKTFIAELKFEQENKLPKNQVAKASPVYLFLQASFFSLSTSLSGSLFPSFPMGSFHCFLLVAAFLPYFPKLPPPKIRYSVIKKWKWFITSIFSSYSACERKRSCNENSIVLSRTNVLANKFQSSKSQKYLG